MINLNIKTKTTLLILSVLVLVLITTIGLALPQIEKTMKKQAIDNLHEMASFLEYQIEQQLNDNLKEIELLSKNPVFLHDDILKDDILYQLNNMKKFFPDYEDITFIDNKGKTIVSTDYRFRGEWKTNKWYQNAVKGNSTISDAYLILSPWELVIQFLSPVINQNGGIIGVISGQMNFNELSDILLDVNIGETGQVRLINNEGKLLVHENKSNIFNKISISNPEYINPNEQMGTGLYITNNRKIIYHYNHIAEEEIFNNNGHWTLLIMQDEEEFNAILTNFRSDMIYISIVISIIILFIGYLFSNSIIKPLDKLKNGMEIISKENNLNYKIKLEKNDELGALAQSFNIMTSKLKNSRKQLSDYNRKLENKVKERTKALNLSMKAIKYQNIELKKTSKLKSDFLNVTSHELRTPMTAMKGYNQMLINEKFGKLNDKQKKALDVIFRNTERLDRLVQDILDTSRLESGTMKFIPKKTNIKKFTDEIVETMQAAGNIKKIKIKSKIDDIIPDLLIDDQRVSQVIRNLINNAIKFSPEGSVINLNVKNNKDNILFELQDFGIGIPKNKIDKIFNVFYQVESGSDRTFGGTGLGLTISRGIVLGHGGDIWVESEKDKGSTFKFTLPKKPINNAEDTFKKINIFELINSLDSKDNPDEINVDIDEKINLLLKEKGV